MTIEQGGSSSFPEHDRHTEKMEADEDMLLGEDDIIEEIEETREKEEEDEGHEPTIIYTSEGTVSRSSPSPPSLTL